MKRMFNKLKNNILIVTILIIIIFIILHFFIGTFNVRFRTWIYCVTSIFILAGTIIGGIQVMIRRKNKFIKIVYSIVLVGIISSFLVLLGFAYTPEHVINKKGKKYVAEVSSFLNVDVYYYDYINFFLMGNKEKIIEHYGNGGYDPFVIKQQPEPLVYYYYDNNGKVIETNDEYYNNKIIKNTIISNEKEDTIKKSETTEEILTQDDISKTNKEDNSEETKILYEKKINKRISIRVIYVGAILGQRTVIMIEKTTDGGQKWNNQLETTDGYMTINNDAKFVFIDENIGFINDSGLAGTTGENRVLLVTTDGGKKFVESVIKIDNTITDDLYIDGVPYIENDKLMLKAYTLKNYDAMLEGYDKNYYYFYSEDNGMSWKQM